MATQSCYIDSFSPRGEGNFSYKPPGRGSWSSTSTISSPRSGFSLVEGFGGHRPKVQQNRKMYGRTFGKQHRVPRTCNDIYGTLHPAKIPDPWLSAPDL